MNKFHPHCTGQPIAIFLVCCFPLKLFRFYKLFHEIKISEENKLIYNVASMSPFGVAISHLLKLYVNHGGNN